MIDQAIILAAGRGTRLHPLTLERSKAMLPVAGKPMVQRVIEGIAASGIEHFIVVISPADRHIVPHFERESSMSAGLRFVVQPHPQGSADALRSAAPLISGDFLVCACDNLVPSASIKQMLETWSAGTRLDGLLGVMAVDPEKTASMGVVTMDGHWVTRIVEKPGPDNAPSNLASLPLYCFSQRILAALQDLPISVRGEYELPDAIQALIERGGRVRGMAVERRRTLTYPADLLALNRHYLANGLGSPEVAPAQIGPNTQLLPPVHIETGAVIGDDCILGPCLSIEGNCTIGDGARVRDAVILRDARIPPGARIAGQVIF